MEDLNLKPCPFCGSEAEFCETEVGCSVECSNFDCNVGMLINSWTKKKAISIWNTRTSCWISVDDIKPELGTFVLVFVGSNNTYIAELLFDEHYKESRWFTDDGGMLNVSPTHWMPLPQMPEVK